MALVSDQAFFANIQYLYYTGQSSNSYSSQDLSSSLTELAGLPFTQSVTVNTPEHISFGYNTYFKLQGFDPITQTYEVWHCEGEPLLSPPSGKTLENITILTSWVDR